MDNAREILQRAREGRYAVGQFNLNSLLWCKEILTAAQQLQSPVILGVTQAACEYMAGMKTVAAMAKAMCAEMRVTVPVALHLDHATLEGAYNALEAGFTSVMYDGSHEPFAVNLSHTTALVQKAHSLGVSVEAELGAPAGEEEGVAPGSGELASPEECRQLAGTGIDALAAGVGNCHGQYPPDWKGLDFNRLAQIAQQTRGLPLVLHGGSGIPKAMVRQAIESGVAKINVNTECQLSFASGVRRYIETGKDLAGGFGTVKLLAEGYAGVRETVMEKMRFFGSVGKGA